jgi:hypothetical protein
MNQKKNAIPTFVVLTTIVLAALPLTAHGEEVNERFRANAIAMGTSNPPIIPAGRTATVDITITRWTTDEEREMLFGELVEHDQEGLVKVLRKEEETGWVRVTGPSRSGSMTRFPSERLRYARETINEDGSRRIVLALDRPISFYEATRQPRWRQYDLTFIVLDVDAEGKGNGQLAVGVQLDFQYASKTLVVENFGTEPVRLNAVTMLK